MWMCWAFAGVYAHVCVCVYVCKLTGRELVREIFWVICMLKWHYKVFNFWVFRICLFYYANNVVVIIVVLSLHFLCNRPTTVFRIAYNLKLAQRLLCFCNLV